MGALPFTADRLARLPRGLLARPELGPLFYAVFAEEKRKDEIPGGPARARHEYYAALARSTVLLSRATEILDAAQQDGLDLLPLKGAVFAPLFYDNPGARPMSDLDFLVRPSELEAACALFESLGYERAYSARLRFTPEHGHDIAFRGRGVLVELHYKLFHELAIDARVEDVFARAIEVELLGAKRRVPSWNDHLFITAVHAATHALSESPIWLFDIALLCQDRRADIVAAQAEARRRRAGIAFCAAIEIVHRYFPERITTLPTEPGYSFRARALARVLGDEIMRERPSQLRSLAARALLTERPRDALFEVARKLGLRARELFESEDDVAIALQSKWPHE